MQGKAPALYTAEPLTDGVHLHNIRSAGQELPSDALQFLRVHQRGFKEGGAASGEKKENGILRF
ncbi:hypothetical protein DSECCO2_289300 [anaerobic digester metagenome]